MTYLIIVKYGLYTAGVACLVIGIADKVIKRGGRK